MPEPIFQYRKVLGRRQQNDDRYAPPHVAVERLNQLAAEGWRVINAVQDTAGKVRCALVERLVDPNRPAPTPPADTVAGSDATETDPAQDVAGAQTPAVQAGQGSVRPPAAGVAPMVDNAG
jgi:hypothetical protein